MYAIFFVNESCKDNTLTRAVAWYGFDVVTVYEVKYACEPQVMTAPQRLTVTVEHLLYYHITRNTTLL